MSYEQLAEHATAIQDKAIQKFVEKMMRQSGENQSPTLYWQLEKWGKELFSDIPQTFQPYTEIPRPELFDPMINAMGLVLGKLSTGEVADDPVRQVSYPANPNLTKVPGVTAVIDDWTGAAASNFKRFFVDPFEAIATNQFLVARVVSAALDCEKQLWSNAQKDIDKIAHSTLEALDKMDECGPNEWSYAFTIGAALAALAGVAISGGGTAILLLGAAEFGAATAATSISYSGESAESVINAMRQGTSELTRRINETEHQIQKAADSTLKALQGDRERYVSKRPDLANANAGNVRSEKYMGHAS